MMTARSAAGAKGDILDAAVALFALHGFDGVSFRDITERCGAKRSLILYHYGSKEDLWRQALRVVLERFNAALEEYTSTIMAARALGERQGVSASLRATLDVHIRVPEFAQILIREGGTPGKRLDWIVANFTPSLALLAAGPAYVRQRVRTTMVRDIILGSMLTATALGPFLEASTSAASHVENAGIHPLNEARRDELVELLTRIIVD